LADIAFFADSNAKGGIRNPIGLFFAGARRCDAKRYMARVLQIVVDSECLFLTWWLSQPISFSTKSIGLAWRL
jgi:hypothetical protein